MYNQNSTQQTNNGQPGYSKGKAIASLVLGICGLVIPYLGLVCSIVGLCLGLSVKKEATKSGQTNGMIRACIILSVIGLVVSILHIVVLAGAFGIQIDTIGKTIAEAVKSHVSN